jgi:hypothetical protein
MSQGMSRGSLTSLLTSLDDLVILSESMQLQIGLSVWSGCLAFLCFFVDLDLFGSFWFIGWTSDAHPLARIQCLSHCGQK